MFTLLLVAYIVKCNGVQCFFFLQILHPFWYKTFLQNLSQVWSVDWGVNDTTTGGGCLKWLGRRRLS